MLNTIEAGIFRYEVRFGEGEVATSPFNLEQQETDSIDSIYQEAAIAGWSHGCPIMIRVIAERTPKLAAKRYSEINYGSNLIRENCNQHNPVLGVQLFQWTSRLEWEKPGLYEPGSVPIGIYQSKMAPLNTPELFGGSRLVTELLTRQPNEEAGLELANKLLTEVIKKSPGRTSFIVRLASSTLAHDFSAEEALKYALPLNVLVEQNCKSLMVEIANLMQDLAPDLARAYVGMNDKQRAELGIATV